MNDRLYQVIYADPPWRFQNWSIGELAKRGEKWGRANGRPIYDCMSTTEIASLPVHRLAAPDCILFLWATYPKLPDALQVIAGWGFTYKTVAFTWVKQRGHGRFHSGLGYWVRQNPEICLLATRGHPKRVSKRVQNLVIAKLREHSAKPPEIRQRIVELCGDVPRIELFARPPVPADWDATGLEISGHDIRLFLENP